MKRFTDMLDDRAIESIEGKTELLDGDYSNRTNPIEKCFKAAVSFGYTVFALQDGGRCASAATARETYQKYGLSTNCSDDGEGGVASNDVYEIAFGKPNFFCTIMKSQRIK